MLNKKKHSRAIKTKSLGQAIAEELRKRIWKGEFKLGERLLEAKLSKEMEISRSSLREALQILEYEGLVVNKVRRGTFVAQFTEKDIQEINELRLHIEVPAMMKTAKVIKESQINELELIIQEMKQCIEIEDWFGLFEADMDFHIYLIQLCENSRIIRLYGIIQNQIRTVLSQLVNYYESRKHEFYEEHEELLRAIRTKNPVEVQNVALSHINHIYYQITNTP